MVLSGRGGVVGGGGNTRIAYGSYNGTGQFGESHKNSLSFGFKPLVVLIGTEASAEDSAFPGLFLRGMSTGHSCHNSMGSGYQLHLTWQGHSVSWYSDSDPYHQMSAKGYTYYYIALGDDSE